MTAARTVALIPAAGSGERLGYLTDDRLPVAKALVPCAGRPLLAWSLLAFAQSEVDVAVIAAPEDLIDAVRDLVYDHCPAGLSVTVTAGGASRSESVRLALRAAMLLRDYEFAAVHDAARPLVEAEAIDACINTLANNDELAGVILAAPVADTIKRVAGDGLIETTADRSGLWAAQTPQVFRVTNFEQAIAVDDQRLRVATDDASLVEAAGGKVAVLDPERLNLKVTTQSDLQMAERELGARLAVSQPE